MAWAAGHNTELIERYRDLFGRHIKRRARELISKQRQIANAAAPVATKQSSNAFKYKRPYNIPPRPKRPSHGRMGDHLKWVPDGQGNVYFDEKAANRLSRHWIIQEVGTGNSATLKVAGVRQPRGGRRKGVTRLVSVRSQMGRRLGGKRNGLAFGAGIGGRYMRPGEGRNQGVYPAMFLTKIEFTPFRRRPTIWIGREIEGQGAVRRGGEIGYLQYYTQMLEAGRDAFKGFPKAW